LNIYKAKTSKLVIENVQKQTQESRNKMMEEKNALCVFGVSLGKIWTLKEAATLLPQ